MLNRTYEFKPLPTATQVETFGCWLDICKSVWNYALAEQRDFARAKKSPVNACSMLHEYIILPDVPKPTFARQCAALAAAKPSWPWPKKPHLTRPAASPLSLGGSLCGGVGERARFP